MRTLTVEPAAINKGAERLNTGEKSGTHSDELLFVVKDFKQIIGKAKLKPIENLNSHKAMWLQNFSCADAEASLTLIKQATMHAWELGYDAAFTNLNFNELKLAGFKELNPAKLKFKTTEKKVFGIELTWDGLKNFTK